MIISTGYYKANIRKRKQGLPYRLIFFFAGALLISITGCVSKFIPEISADQDLIVVEGIITDQPGAKIISITTSTPLGERSTAKPLTGCNVTLTDDAGSQIQLSEISDGKYATTSDFLAVIGRSYTLHIKTSANHHNKSYESSPVLMKPVPPIDSLYYEKIVLTRSSDGVPSGEGCQVFLNSHDPENKCRYYRWEYVETWEFKLPYYVNNRKCWVTDNSDRINIKTTSSLSEDRVTRVPVNYITNESDRLNIKYSILVNQYSLTEQEFNYWDKLKNTVEQVGSLYDIIPSSIPGNIKCNENPAENVLGYFSVSSVKSKRIFIENKFRGMANLYLNCENTSVPYDAEIPGLDITKWIIIWHPEPPPGYKVLTFIKGCADCTVRGTTSQPDFWTSDDK
jgi:hypothetical protein